MTSVDEAKTEMQAAETPAEVLQVIGRVMCKSKEVPPTEADLAN